MISTDEALARVLALFTPLPAEEVPLAEAGGRVLARAVAARRDQPPFAASAMDGYALRGDEVRPGARFRVVGEAAAGHAFAGAIGPGEALRIFTGAPVPAGADRVVIQEDTIREGDAITLADRIDPKPYVRPAGGDFAAGAELSGPRRLTPADIALLASMNHAALPVTRRPVVALIATGDELVMPGETPRADQIIASNSFGLKALLEAQGAEARMLPIARDSVASLRAVLDLASDADLIVTIGGASVGDHDLVQEAAGSLGLELDFYKIRMRPGKPLMAGRLNGTPMIGLPGNPVSSMVCGHLFLRPAVDAMLGLPARGLPRERAPLAHELGPNGPREHFMRATLGQGPDGPALRVAGRQDSSLLSVLAGAGVLAVRPPDDPPRAAGDILEFIRI